MSLRLPQPGEYGTLDDFPAKYHAVLRRAWALVQEECPGFQVNHLTAFVWQARALLAVCRNCFQPSRPYCDVVQLTFGFTQDGKPLRAAVTLCENEDICLYQGAVCDA